MDVPSKSQVKKAGSILRKYMRGALNDEEAVVLALDTMEAWRRAHYEPLLSANNGLRSRPRTARVRAAITQRLKRRHPILDKLGRETATRTAATDLIRDVVSDRSDGSSADSQLRLTPTA